MGTSIVLRRALALIVVLLVVACEDEPTGTTLDRWPVATPASQGLDPDILSEMTSELERGTFGRISSLLIVRHGHLVYEEYFRGMTRSDLHPIYSVTKSVTSALIGIAIDEGNITDVDAGLLDLFPEYSELANMSAQKSRISLEHVLEMRAGLEWDEWSSPYATPENPTTQLVASSDWVKFVLDLPMAHEPGTAFTYNSGCTMLLSGVLRNRVGMSAETYARRKLFGPLGIEIYQWQTGPDNVSNTGWGLALRPRDMARFGYLYLENGYWDGRPVISSDWLSQSLTAYTSFSSGNGYGYQWWLLAVEDGGSEAFIPYAAGWGGQYIFVVPRRDMVVVSTAEEYEGGSEIGSVLFDYVFAADLEEAGALPNPLSDEPAIASTF